MLFDPTQAHVDMFKRACVALEIAALDSYDSEVIETGMEFALIEDWGGEISLKEIKQEWVMAKMGEWLERADERNEKGFE